MSHVLVSETRPDPDTVRELLGTIHSEAYELDRMVADLLVMARLDSEAVLFKAEPVDVEQAINLAVEPARRAGHDIAVDAPIGVVAVADQARLVHILRTLLSNAKKHGGPSTRVFTTCTTGKVAITVEDDGRGPETPDTLFEGFTNVGKEALIIGSVGIGLNVAQGLARKMNGQITFTRAEGLTRFNVILPLHESSRQLAPPEPVYGAA
jgi:signal transduction histidine kinase